MLHGCVRTLVFSGADTGTPARFATVLAKIRTIVEQIRDAIENLLVHLPARLAAGASSGTR